MSPAPFEESISATDLRWRLAAPPAEHPIFAGHFPGYPVLPGVIVLGWMMAAAERFLGREISGPTRLHNVKFPLVLLPGQEVELHVATTPSGRLAVRVFSPGGTHASVIIEMIAPGAAADDRGNRRPTGSP